MAWWMWAIGAAGAYAVVKSASADTSTTPKSTSTPSTAVSSSSTTTPVAASTSTESAAIAAAVAKVNAYWKAQGAAAVAKVTSFSVSGPRGVPAAYADGALDIRDPLAGASACAVAGAKLAADPNWASGVKSYGVDAMVYKAVVVAMAGTLKPCWRTDPTLISSLAKVALRVR
jgi:hypothetical protein